MCGCIETLTDAIHMALSSSGQDTTLSRWRTRDRNPVVSPIIQPTDKALAYETRRWDACGRVCIYIIAFSMDNACQQMQPYAMLTTHRDRELSGSQFPRVRSRLRVRNYENGRYYTALRSAEAYRTTYACVALIGQSKRFIPARLLVQVQPQAPKTKI